MLSPEITGQPHCDYGVYTQKREGSEVIVWGKNMSLHQYLVNLERIMVTLNERDIL